MQRSTQSHRHLARLPATEVNPNPPLQRHSPLSRIDHESSGREILGKPEFTAQRPVSARVRFTWKNAY